MASGIALDVRRFDGLSSSLRGPRLRLRRFGRWDPLRRRVPVPLAGGGGEVSGFQGLLTGLGMELPNPGIHVPVCPGCQRSLAGAPTDFLNDHPVCRSCFKLYMKLMRLVEVAGRVRR